MREYCGFESDADAHRHIKSAFYGVAMDDHKLPSMANMGHDEASRFLEYAIRVAAELGLVLPDPVSVGRPREAKERGEAMPWECR
jgi:hypothetical protein